MGTTNIAPGPFNPPDERRTMIAIANQSMEFAFTVNMKMYHYYFTSLMNDGREDEAKALFLPPAPPKIVDDFDEDGSAHLMEPNEVGYDFVCENEVYNQSWNPVKGVWGKEFHKKPVE